MTSMEYEAVASYRGWVRDLLARAGWCLLLLPPMVFAWRASHFQYDIYLPGESASITGTVMLLLAIVSAAMIASLTWFKAYARTLVMFAVGYAMLVVFHSSLNQALTGGGTLTLALESVVFAFLMLPIISDRGVLLRFLKLNFALGLALVALNMVTVLHWWGMISLPHHHVRRFGVRPDRELCVSRPPVRHAAAAGVLARADPLGVFRPAHPVQRSVRPGDVTRAP
jgi:hypothetical protein